MDGETEMDNDNYTLTAHWYVREHEFFTCSNCGFDVPIAWDSTPSAEKQVKTFHEEYRYCPGCGRKMEAPVEKQK